MNYINLEIEGNIINLKTNLNDVDEVLANLTATLITYAVQYDISKELLLLSINETYDYFNVEEIDNGR